MCSGDSSSSDAAGLSNIFTPRKKAYWIAMDVVRMNGKGVVAKSPSAAASVCLASEFDFGLRSYNHSRHHPYSIMSV